MKFRIDFLRKAIFIIILIKTFVKINSLTTIPLQISTAEYKREYLQSLKFLQLMLLNPILSSFLSNQEISLHQQVLAQKRLATYYGELQVGTSEIPQTFRMLFDTGSCEFWIPSDECNSDRCTSHNRYKASPSLKPFNQTKMDIQYLSGHVSGDMVLETINLGGITVKDQVIGLAKQIDIPLMNEVIWDGILGLAYPNKNLKSKNISPIIDNIIKQNILHQMGEKNQFSYYLGLNNGAITFGGADMKYKKDMNEEFKWAPIAEKNYWTITLLDIKKYPKVEPNPMEEIVGDVLCPEGCNSIVDTGTYLIYGPSSQIKKFLADLNLEKCEDKKNLPNLGLVFKGFKVNGQDNAFELTLTPDDYVLEFEVDGKTDCVIGFGSDGEDNGWTLGQVFLKAYYTVFDRETESIGFAKSNPEPGMIVKKQNNNSQNLNASNGNIQSSELPDVKLNGDFQNGPINLEQIKQFDQEIKENSTIKNDDLNIQTNKNLENTKFTSFLGI